MKIIVCGCSFSSWSGMFSQHEEKNYGDFLAEDLNATVENLAYPACSNYAISLQVEEAIKRKPDLIVFNTTSVGRFEFLNPGKQLPEPGERKLTYDDLIQYRGSDGAIYSIHHALLGMMVEKSALTDDPNWNYSNFTQNDVEELYTHIVKHQSLTIKHDIDRIIVKGTIASLLESTIDFICFDTMHLVDNPHIKVLNQPWLDQVRNFRNVNGDPVHWNEDGHRDIATRLIKQYITN